MKFKSLTIAQQEERFRQSLKVVPVHNSSAKVTRNDKSGEIEVEIALRYDGAVMQFLQKVFKLRNSKRYVLDVVGSMVYEAVDGKKSFEQLIDEFSEKQKLTFFESRALLGQYFQTLVRRGVIVATLPQGQQ